MKIIIIAAIAWLLCAIIAWLLWYPVRHTLGKRVVWAMVALAPLTLFVAMLHWTIQWLRDDDGNV